MCADGPRYQGKGWQSMTIVVSHSSSDADAVRSLVQGLEGAGARVWLDQDLTGGQAWWTAILGQIRDCNVFVFALSESSLQSEACLLELTYARDLGLPILPVQLGDLRGLRDHAIFAYQAIDYRNPTASAGIALVRGIHERERERQPLPEPLPPPPPPPYEYLMLLGTAIHGRAALSPTEQESILLQLRQALRAEKNESVRQNVRTLLATLRERPEVTHRTATEITTLLDNGQPDQSVSTPAAERTPAAGWYPDPGGGPQPRYWDGQRWHDPVANRPNPQPQHVAVQQFVAPPDRPTGKAFSIIAFVFAAIAFYIPLLGLLGVGAGLIGRARKERMGVTASIVAAVATVLAWVIWTSVYSR